MKDIKELADPAQPVAACAAPSSDEVGQLHPDMARSAARSALNYAGSFNDKGIDWNNDKPWPHRMELAQALDWITELGAMVLNLADRVTPSAPSSDEVRGMVARLYGDIDGGPSSWLKQEAADLIERLAARVPDGCVVVGYLDGRGRFFYADDPHMEIDHTGMREVFAAGKVKS